MTVRSDADDIRDKERELLNLREEWQQATAAVGELDARLVLLEDERRRAMNDERRIRFELMLALEAE